MGLNKMDERARLFNEVCNFLMIQSNSRIQIGSYFVGYRDDINEYAVYHATKTDVQYFSNFNILWQFLDDNNIIG